MTIEILPARLANQIAAGEVVERPASVVKELVENSLDAGATAIKIEIEKGGAKRIRISDNGSGIVKDELTLALSRHATSKIKNLTDLEAICSLGFRGEALASISSVARLTLTSKPQTQETAWQACAEGRDMAVSVQPAAHTNGTTIDVVDLFFNTPARRKFLRTEKTEFTHIEEVIKRIALARFDVAFTLVHNGKVIRQYRLAQTDGQKAKRVAQVCGQAFIDNAISIDCQHDGLSLSGWLAHPSFHRNQNDLCYSYVNGRMMRDKLINHAIRQSYQELLPSDSYPCFVLFLTLDAREVDVNVHPAKHEVRFHQGRYVHDFIYSVCQRALTQQMQQTQQTQLVEAPETAVMSIDNVNDGFDSPLQHAYQETRAYVSELRPATNTTRPSALSGYSGTAYSRQANQYKNHITTEASAAYQALMTPLAIASVSENEAEIVPGISVSNNEVSLQFVAPAHALYVVEHQPRLISLAKLMARIQTLKIAMQWQQGLTSQPLLLPVKLSLSASDFSFINKYQQYFEKLGIVAIALDKSSIQIRQFPALLRNQDVSQSISQLLTMLQAKENEQGQLSDEDWQACTAQLIAQSKLVEQVFDQALVADLVQQLKKYSSLTIFDELALNSTAVDLTSAIQALN